MFSDQSNLRTLLDSLHEGVYYVDLTRRITYWNRMAETITGFSAQEVVGKCCADNILIHVDEDGNSLCRGACPLAACMKDGVQRTAKVYAHHKEGHRFPVKLVVAPIRDDSGAVVGGLETFVDASTELAALRVAQEQDAETLLCPLTGIGSQGYARDSLVTALNGLQSNEKLLVLLLDIDEFQGIAAKYGKTVSDIVLKMVARTLAGALRSIDFVGRWREHGFLVLIPYDSKGYLEQASNRLRVLVERSSRQISKGHLSTTVSVGATEADKSNHPSEIIQRVESGALASDLGGHNRVTLQLKS